MLLDRNQAPCPHFLDSWTINHALVRAFIPCFYVLLRCTWFAEVIYFFIFFANRVSQSSRFSSIPDLCTFSFLSTLISYFMAAGHLIRTVVSAFNIFTCCHSADRWTSLWKRTDMSDATRTTRLPRFTVIYQSGLGFEFSSLFQETLPMLTWCFLRRFCQCYRAVHL